MGHECRGRRRIQPPLQVGTAGAPLREGLELGELGIGGLDPFERRQDILGPGAVGQRRSPHRLDDTTAPQRVAAPEELVLDDGDELVEAAPVPEPGDQVRRRARRFGAEEGHGGSHPEQAEPAQERPPRSIRETTHGRRPDEPGRRPQRVVDSRIAGQRDEDSVVLDRETDRAGGEQCGDASSVRGQGCPASLSTPPVPRHGRPARRRPSTAVTTARSTDNPVLVLETLRHVTAILGRTAARSAARPRRRRRPAEDRSAPTAPRLRPRPLTPAERRVVDLVVEGLTNAQIASRLVVSRRTVDTQVLAVYRKLGVRSRVELTRALLLPGGIDDASLRAPSA